MTTIRMPFNRPSPRSKRRWLDSRRARMAFLYTPVLSSSRLLSLLQDGGLEIPRKTKLALREKGVERMGKGVFRERNGCSRTDFSLSLFLLVPKALVGASENRARGGGLAAIHALPVGAFLLQGNAAHGGAGFFFDFGFAFTASAPERIGKAALHSLFEVVIRLGVVRIALAECQRLVVQRLLNLSKQLLNRAR